MRLEIRSTEFILSVPYIHNSTVDKPLKDYFDAEDAGIVIYII